MSVPPPFTLKKYFDVSLPTATVQPTAISKVNTGQSRIKGGFKGLTLLLLSTLYLDSVVYDSEQYPIVFPPKMPLILTI